MSVYLQRRGAASSLALLAGLCLAACLATGALACGGDGSADGHARRLLGSGGAVKGKGKGGSWCSIVHPSDARADEIDAEVRGWLKNHPEWDAPGNSANSNGNGNGQTQGAKNGRRSLITMRTIYVYWHVIQASDGTGYVPQSQVGQQIAALNVAYNPWGFNFVAAGTAGYEVITNDAWFDPISDSTFNANWLAMAKQLRKGSAQHLNVYTTNSFQTGSSQILGVAAFPWDYTSNPKKDGVQLLWSAVTGGPDPSTVEGDTLVHEVGHWLGLFHTFQGGCDAVYGDRVADTPAESLPGSSCTPRDSCYLPGTDPLDNFMDYTADACMDKFTPGQANRAQNMWAAYRYNK